MHSLTHTHNSRHFNHNIKFIRLIQLEKNLIMNGTSIEKKRIINNKRKPHKPNSAMKTAKHFSPQHKKICEAKQTTAKKVNERERKKTRRITANKPNIARKNIHMHEETTTAGKRERKTLN